MNRTNFSILVLAALLLLAPAGSQAVTREVAELRTAPLATRQSVISQLSSGVLRDPYDEFLLRPYNLGFANIERYGNLTPWPGQEGEQNRYVDFLIGNNGNSNVRNGADTVQGTYIGQGMEKIAWGISAAYLADDVQNASGVNNANFADGEKLSGFDLRGGVGARLSDRFVIGGGISAFDQGDEVTDTGLNAGGGSFFTVQELKQSGFEADFGVRMFIGERSSWDARLLAGTGSTENNDYSDNRDDAGAFVSRWVVKEYDVGDTWMELSGGYNRRYLENGGGMQVRAGVRSSSRELNNNQLAYSFDGMAIDPRLVLIDQDPVSENEIFASADTLFLRGWTQIFGGVRLSMSQVDGSSRSDSVGTIVDESIDDSWTRVALVAGLRQPLWNERFRLVARARADWVSASTLSINGPSTTGQDTVQTTTGFAFGIETVLNNMVFDLAWLFGGDPAPGGATDPSRQTIDLDRLVISATFGW